MHTNNSLVELRTIYSVISIVVKKINKNKTGIKILEVPDSGLRSNCRVGFFFFNFWVENCRVRDRIRFLEVSRMSVTSNFKWGGKMLRISSHGIIPRVDRFVESDGSGFSQSPSQPCEPSGGPHLHPLPRVWTWCSLVSISRWSLFHIFFKFLVARYSIWKGCKLLYSIFYHHWHFDHQPLPPSRIWFHFAQNFIWKIS